MSAIFEQAVDTWRRCRDEYELYVEAQLDLAETECRGNLVSERGRRAGVTARALFSGNAAHAYAYASDELVEFWLVHHRMSFDAFERQWIAADGFAARYVTGLTY